MAVNVKWIRLLEIVVSWKSLNLTLPLNSCCFFSTKININPFIYNVEKWSNIRRKSCFVNASRFLKYVWPFFNIIHESIKFFFASLQMVMSPIMLQRSRRKLCYSFWGIPLPFFFIIWSAIFSFRGTGKECVNQIETSTSFKYSLRWLQNKYLDKNKFQRRCNNSLNFIFSSFTKWGHKEYFKQCLN